MPATLPASEICVHSWPFVVPILYRYGLENNAFPFEFRFREIQDDAHAQARDFQIIEHPSAFVIADALDHLRIDNDQAEDDEIGNIEANVMALVANRKGRLLLEADLLPKEAQAVRLDLRFVQNLLAGREERFRPSSQFVFIRVHSWFTRNCWGQSPTRIKFTFPAA